MHPTRTMTFPDNSYTAPYVLIYDLDTGYLADGTTGVPAVDTTWTNAALDENHGIAKAGTNLAVWKVTIPPLDDEKNWGLLICDNATPANTDVPDVKAMYNARTGRTYTDAVPTHKGRVF